MHEKLREAELFEGLNERDIERLASVGRLATLNAGDYLFLLGDSAQNISIVLKGQIDLCFPISIGGVIRDISVETVGPGGTIGWSALVKPFKFTLSARAAEATELISFGRQALQQLTDRDSQTGLLLFARISELMAGRLAMFQALWARELQRTVETGRGAGAK